MIFINRKRMIGTIKDPSKYWYVEKYVYGELKETIEVPLRTSIKFTAIKSPRLNDLFSGWSVINTSTTTIYNENTYYKNTSSNIASHLDSNNTLKIYAVYRYSNNTVYNISDSVQHTNPAERSGIYISSDYGKLTIGGYINYEDFSATSSTPTQLTKYTNVSCNVNTSSYRVNTKTGSSKTVNIIPGDVIKYTISGGVSVISSSGGSNGAVVIPTLRAQSSYITLNSTIPMYNLSVPYYRV